MKKISTITLSCILTIFTTACSMSPPQVKPSLNLVKEQAKFDDYQKVPSEFWPRLDQDPSNTVVPFNQLLITLNGKYTSALGVICRKVVVSRVKELSSEQHILCKNTDNTWFIVPQIMDRESDDVFAE